MSIPLFWFILGAVLISIELFSPVFVFLFLGIGAWITSFFSYWLEISLSFGFFVFIITSLILLFIQSRYIKNIYSFNSPVLLKKKGIHANKRAMVISEIKSDKVDGLIELEGSYWSAVSTENIKVGETVIIERHDVHDDLLLHVKPISNEK